MPNYLIYIYPNLWNSSFKFSFRFKTDSESHESEYYDEDPVIDQIKISDSMPANNKRQSINSMLASNFKVERIQTHRSSKSGKHSNIAIWKLNSKLYNKKASFNRNYYLIEFLDSISQIY